MGKALKNAMLGVVIFIVIIALAAYYVFGNIDRLVEVAIEKVGPQVTGTPVRVSSVSIALKDGRGEISGLTIGNPDGYQSDHALRIGRLAFDLDTKTITADPVRITEISVSDTDLIAELGPAGLNLKALLDNLDSGGSEKAAQSESTASGPGLVIDRFDFTGARMTLETPVKDYDTTVPDVKLTGIGEKEGGATAAEAAEQILRPVIAAAIKAAQEEAGAQGLDGYQQSVTDRVKEEANKLKDKLKLGN